MSEVQAYPAELACMRTLFDGTQVCIRPIKVDDADIEQDFVRHLSKESRYYRFMHQTLELTPQELDYFTHVDYDRHMAFVATVSRDGAERQIGVARYIAEPNGDSCEFAIAVDDDWQGTGVAGMLMAALMDAARGRGFKTMVGLVMATNHKMLKFARQLGFTLRRNEDDPQTVRAERGL